MKRKKTDKMKNKMINPSQIINGDISFIGFIIRDLREQKQISRKHLSETTGISYSYLCDVESGIRSNITMKTLLNIAAALDVSMSEFFSEYDKINFSNNKEE